MSHHSYATENALVDAEWAKAHLDDPSVRFVEVDVDTTAFEQSHLPGAVGWNWTSQLADGVRRDIAGREDFSALLSGSGIGPDTTVVLYGDNNNWFAAWAYWQLKLYGHKDVRILNGGRKYWLDNGLPLSVDVTAQTATNYQLPEADFSLRAFRDDILPRLGDPELVLVDVRSPAEFNGDIIAPPGMSRPHPGCGVHPVGPDGQGRRHVQVRRRPSRHLRSQGHHARQGRHRLLPDRRALLALLVRPARVARLPTGPQLRRFVDGVGQPHQRSDREASRGRRGVLTTRSPGSVPVRGVGPPPVRRLLILGRAPDRGRPGSHSASGPLPSGT